jgi:hypothetical protein
MLGGRVKWPFHLFSWHRYLQNWTEWHEGCKSLSQWHVCANELFGGIQVWGNFFNDIQLKLSLIIPPPPPSTFKFPKPSYLDCPSWRLGSSTTRRSTPFMALFPSTSISRLTGACTDRRCPTGNILVRRSGTGAGRAEPRPLARAHAAQRQGASPSGPTRPSHGAPRVGDRARTYAKRERPGLVPPPARDEPAAQRL